jgi:starvation-inducible DNA-binding protein
MYTADTALAAADGAPGASRANDLAQSLNAILADVFVLYVKTKAFHWHVTGPHFRDYRRLLDEQAAQVFATIDLIAERVRKIGGDTLRSVGDIARRQRLSDNDHGQVQAADMLAELRRDNAELAALMREAHALCDEHGDIATASLLENWVDEAEGRVWFLSAATGG